MVWAAGCVTLTTALTVAEHPPVVPVTERMVGLVTLLRVIAVVLAPLLQRYESAPEAVSVAEPPEVMVCNAGVMVTEGRAVTIPVTATFCAVAPVDVRMTLPEMLPVAEADERT